MNELEYSLQNSLDSKDLEFVDVSGIESFVGLPLQNDDKNNINDKKEFDFDTKLKRFLIILKGIKNKILNGTIKEGFENSIRDTILKDVNELIKKNKIHNNKKVKIKQTIHKKDRIVPKDDNSPDNELFKKMMNNSFSENLEINSSKSEGIDTIFQPSIKYI